MKTAKFEKVSYSQFRQSIIKITPDATEETLRHMYDQIKLPCRATTGSAGYDFYAPFGFTLKPQETLTIPTGIRAHMISSWVLMLFPRSGLGFKYRLQLNNTVGIIDSDYYDSDNEGHIFIKLTNDTNEARVLTVSQGEGIAQGIFLPYGLTDDDDVSDMRNGGFGSTNKI